ncbi:hypothetical protein [Marinigracilibium pacificum]|uniref:Uncharacterized protein n=1 Tax=Marinigracilibium pacificum TaxID=2729599 RepID=A0A848IWM4_9BACT|nr:hypothetical protein [Marinigracilibium pacificum]NMM48727.1 hypothetical protein [Marinigracilibium pacificum]
MIDFIKLIGDKILSLFNQDPKDAENEKVFISEGCFGKIEEVGDVYYIMISIQGVIDPDEFRRVMEWALIKVKSGNYNIIINSGSLKAMPKESMEYMDDYWLPEALKHNLNLVVIIRPTDLFGYISLEAICKKFPIMNYKFVPSMLDAQLEILKIS